MERVNGAITIESKPKIKSIPIMAEIQNAAPTPNDQVRIVGLEDCKEAAKCLAEAFMEDDVARYFIHTDPAGFQYWSPEALKLHYSICEYLVYAHCLKGLVTTTGPDYDSVALWYFCSAQEPSYYY